MSRLTPAELAELRRRQDELTRRDAELRAQIAAAKAGKR